MKGTFYYLNLQAKKQAQIRGEKGPQQRKIIRIDWEVTRDYLYA
jgi:hypothetical protein